MTNKSKDMGLNPGVQGTWVHGSRAGKLADFGSRAAHALLKVEVKTWIHGLMGTCRGQQAGFFHYKPSQAKLEN